MNRRVLFTIIFALLSSLAIGQTNYYGPRGISPTIPILPIAPIEVTPPVPTIPTTSSTNQLPITPPLTTIPLVYAVPPPIEPSPTERMQNALRYASMRSATAENPAGAFFNPGVTSTGSRTEDGTYGNSLGAIARKVRRCTPNVTGRTFTNDDFERVAGDNVPTLIQNVCAPNRW